MTVTSNKSTKYRQWAKNNTEDYFCIITEKKIIKEILQLHVK